MKEENYDHYVVFIGYLHEEEVHVVKQLETIDMDQDENNPRDLTDFDIVNISLHFFLEDIRSMRECIINCVSKSATD